MKPVNNLLILATASAFLAGCQKESAQLPVFEESSSINMVNGAVEKLKNRELELNISGLEDLGPNARYEGWVIINGNPVSTGVFAVNSQGQMSQTIFEVPATEGKLKEATAFVLTIEPYPDPSPEPSNQHLMAGNFEINTASLSIGHPAALNSLFTSAAGHFLLATPTTVAIDDEKSGIWFINASSGAPAAGLQLPALPAGWRYEGWVVINGVPVSTGAFMQSNAADAAAPFSGPLPGPPFPGEDFIINAPASLTFPTNLSGSMAVITVEPYPDNSPAPFLLKPLVRMIPNPAMQHFTYAMNLNPGSFPTGTAVTKK
jgi:hypothetical protein